MTYTQWHTLDSLYFFIFSFQIRIDLDRTTERYVLFYNISITHPHVAYAERNNRTLRCVINGNKELYARAYSTYTNIYNFKTFTDSTRSINCFRDEIRSRRVMESLSEGTMSDTSVKTRVFCNVRERGESIIVRRNPIDIPRLTVSPGKRVMVYLPQRSILFYSHHLCSIFFRLFLQ